MRTARPVRRLSTALLAGLAVVGASLVATPPAAAASVAGDSYVQRGARIADTRTGLGVRKGAIPRGGALAFPVAGRGGVPGSGAAAATLSLTAYAPTAATSLTVYRYGATRPALADLHVGAGETASVSVPVLLGSGRVVVYATQAVQVSLDVQAWHTTGATASAGGRLVPTGAVRLLDTRSGTGAPRAALAAGRTLTLTVAGRGGVPATGATSAALNVTDLGSTAAGSLTVWPYGQARPATPNVSFKPGADRSALVQVPLGSGRVSVYNASARPVHVLADVQGWYAAASTTARNRFVPKDASRFLDTRTGVGAPRAALGPNGSATVTVAGRNGYPTGGVNAVPVTLTAWAPTAATALTVYASGAVRPVATFSVPRGRTLATTAMVPLGAGKLVVHNSAGSTHVSLDARGWYEAPTVAAPTVGSSPTSVVDVAKRLYTGAGAVQTGVAAGAVDLTRVAVLQGRLLTKTAAALPGVRVAVLDHPELGATTTQTDGSFAMAVNGGGQLTVVLSKAGHLSAQRDVSPEWLSYASVPEVRLVAVDTAATPVDLTASTTATFAKSTTTTDAAGARQVGMLFEPGTSATMTLADGSTKPVPDTSVRATEFTVGTGGGAAMPGELPSSSGYTYASELSLDAAQAAGATRVDFNKPVWTYVDNFLGFPAGTPVPAGYFDRDQGKWIAAPDGRVIDLVSETGGKADVDVDGDGAADAGSALLALGIDDAERTQLALRYDASPSAHKSLWRVGVTHFTPWDYNWPFGPPPDAISPNGEPPLPPQGPDQQCQQGGSVISCESQTLGESIAITGTDLALHYSSDRVGGNRAAATVDVPLSGSSVPGSLNGIKLTVQIAGQVAEQGFSAGPDKSARFTWDGRDGRGNVAQGAQSAKVTIGYAYTPVYYAPATSSSSGLGAVVLPSAFESSFARFGTQPITRGGDPITGAQSIYISKSFEVALGTYDARGVGLGGWSLGTHHVYDPAQRVLYRGDGTRQSSEAMRPVLKALAGAGYAGAEDGAGDDASFSSPTGLDASSDGSVYVADTGNDLVRKISATGVVTTVAGGGSPDDGIGDGGAATAARLVAPQDVAVAADGTLYVADTGNNRVRRIAKDGTITTVLGGNDPADGIGDGPDASLVALDAPRGIGLGPDGSLYVADTGHGRVRSLALDGSVLTVAGGGAPVDGLGDGGDARLAALSTPSDVAVLDGSVLVSDTGHDRVRRVGVDGRITTFAGTGTTAALQDGKPATASPLARPGALAVALDGTVYVTDRGHHVVREVRQDGILNTAAGNGTGGHSGDGGPPLAAQLSLPQGVAAAPNGDLVVADTGTHRVRAVRPALPGLGSTTLVVVAQDGKELYTFDGTGRHLQTRDALSGAITAAFTYDSAGRLLTITDADGLVTTVERDSAGNPAALVAPYGQRTSLTVATGGYLASATDPGGRRVSLTYGTEGLLTGMVDAGGGVHAYLYDAVGRLVKDTGPTGTSKTLTRTSTARGYRVDVATTAGRTTRFAYQVLSDGTVKRTQTVPAGAVTTTLRRPDGTVVTTTPDGVTRTQTSSGDPRWGMQAPFVSRTEVRQPDGRVSVGTQTRAVVLTTPTDPMTMTTLTTVRTVDGRATTTVWDTATRRISTTGPTGRTWSTTLDTRGRVVSAEDSGTTPTTTSYDAKGRPVSRTTGTGAGARSTAMAYDALGRLSTSTDELGRTVTYGYDANGRLASVKRSDGATTTSTYDAFGNLVSLAAPGRAPMTWTYDKANRVTATSAPAVSGVPSVTATTYDADGIPLTTALPGGRTITRTVDAAGRIVGTTDGTVTLTSAYDSADRLVSAASTTDGVSTELTYTGPQVTRTQTTGPVAGSVVLAYGSDSRLASRTVAGGPSVAYSWDAEDHLTQVGPLSLQRDAQGRGTGTTQGQVQTEVTYDAFGEVVGRVVSIGGAPWLSTTWQRDKAGRTLSRTDTEAGVVTTTSYAYDTAGRLAGVTRDGTVRETYAYDANGNRTSAVVNGTSRTASYDAQDRLVADGAEAWTYNAQGQASTRTLAGKTTTYAYDGFGALRRVVLSDGHVVTYVLDGLSRRVGKKVDGVLTQGWLYAGTDLLPVAQTDGAGTVTARFTWSGGSGAPATITKGSSTYRVVTDERSSPVAVIDSGTGAVVQRMTYDGYGRVLTDSAPGFQPFGFGGGLYDPDTGLVRLGARDYDAATGRWTTKDPAGPGGGTNLYEYGLGDPVNATDPLGLIFGMSWPSRQDFVDASAGIGDAMSFGLTKWMRHSVEDGMGWDSLANECSENYTWGHRGGTALSVAIGAGPGLRAAAAGARGLAWGAAEAASGARGAASRAPSLVGDFFDALGTFPEGASPISNWISTPASIVREIQSYGMGLDPRNYLRLMGSQTWATTVRYAQALGNGMTRFSQGLMNQAYATHGYVPSSTLVSRAQGAFFAGM